MGADMLIRLAAGVVLIAMFAGCGSSPGTSGEGSGGAAVSSDRSDREATVYAAVLRHYLTGPDSTARDRKWSTVFVLDRAVKRAADPDRTLDDIAGPAIAPQTRDRITRELAGVAPVRFVADGRGVRSKDGCDMAKPDTILVTLGPVPETGDRVAVGFNGWQGCLAGIWQTYLVTHDGDTWRVTGTTGPVGIS